MLWTSTSLNTSCPNFDNWGILVDCVLRRLWLILCISSPKGCFQSPTLFSERNPHVTDTFDLLMTYLWFLLITVFCLPCPRDLSFQAASLIGWSLQVSDHSWDLLSSAGFWEMPSMSQGKTSITCHLGHTPKTAWIRPGIFSRLLSPHHYGNRRFCDCETDFFFLYPRFGRLLLLFTVYTDPPGKVHASLVII